jgi:iron complex outermembrane receptor protein
MNRFRHTALAAVCMMTSAGACAQRAEENAITAATDAFGTSIGAQTVGLYSQVDARGFNPQQAGNLRIEGLYFDQQTYATNPCMVRETAMRIGIAAQTYSFPSPTGIADFSLRTPTDVQSFSGNVIRGPFNGVAAQVEEQLPIVGKALGADLCGGYSRNTAPDSDRRDQADYYAVTLRWHPGAATEIVPFWSYFEGSAREVLPSVFTDGTVRLPEFREVDLGTQKWASQTVHMTTLGAVARSARPDHWQLAAGLFHSLENDPPSVSPYFQLQQNGNVDSNVDVSPPLKAQSTSGEIRVTGTSIQDVHRHQLQVALRGRIVDRAYGGDDNIDFGSVPLFNQTIYVEPLITLSAQSRDRTQQVDLGAAYEESWQGVGSAALGVLKSNYRRTTTVPFLPSGTTGDEPWLMNLRVAGEAGRQVIYYGSFTQGLEDSALAPVSAVNRGEPPASTRTWQLDGGLRYVSDDQLTLIVGVFDIHKPYLNLDASNVYRPLGRLRNRGLETSVSYKDGGFTVLGGAVRLQPEADLTVPNSGTTSSEPVGPVPMTLNLNFDYGPVRWGPWAASLQLNRLSSRYETSDDRNRLPPLTTVAAGLRYKWAQGNRSWTLRADGFNLANARNLHVSSLGLVLPEQGRRFALTLGTDL